MITKKGFKEKQHEQERGKRRYLERVIEEKEAQKEIDSYQEKLDVFPERNNDRTE